MALPKICNTKNLPSLRQGITLLEVIIVMTIITILGGLTLSMGFETFRGSSLRNERDQIVSALQRARNQSINNICIGSSCTGGKPHGVHFDDGNYTIFQGESYLTRDVALDEVIYPTYDIDYLFGSLTEVVFAQLSGDTSTLPVGTSNITLTDTTSIGLTISIDPEGRIFWTN